MRQAIILAATFLTTLAVTNAMSLSASTAAPPHGSAVTNRIGHGGSTYDTAHGVAHVTDGCTHMNQTGAKVDVIERIGHGGSTYFSSQLTSDHPINCTSVQARVKIEERIGHGGSTYSYGASMTN